MKCEIFGYVHYVFDGRLLSM